MLPTVKDANFMLAGPVDIARDGAGEPILDSPPHLRYANEQGLKLNPYGLGPFSKLIVPALPDAPGVYAVSENDMALYVGRARDSLRQRWGRRGYSVIDPRNCFAGGQSTNCRINSAITRAVMEGRALELWIRASDDPVALAVQLRMSLRPPWNIR